MRVQPRSLVFAIIALLGACRPALLPSPSEPPETHYVRRVNADTVIVFVHGIFGDASSTWTNSTTGAYWPKLLTADTRFDGADVYVYAYPSPHFGSASSIDELVEQMNSILVADEVFAKHKRVVFLCHSMGGLVIRKLLTRYQPLATQVPLIYFFSTPTTGADVTRLARVFSTNPQIADMSPSEADRYVDILQRDWRAARLSVVSRCAYEANKTNGIKIVDPSSASMLCDGPVLPIFKNHMEIVKPADVRDLSYLSFKEAFSQMPTGTTPADSGAAGSALNVTRKTAVALATRPITVKCGQTKDAILSVPLPTTPQPGGRLVDAVVSIQQTSDLKQYRIEVAKRSESSVDLHYRLTGLDPIGGACATDGIGTVVIAFILVQPVESSSATTAETRQATKGDASPAIYGVTGNVTIIRDAGDGASHPGVVRPANSPSLSLATVPSLQGMLLDQNTRGELSPAVAAVGGSVFIYDSTQSKSKAPVNRRPR